MPDDLIYDKYFLNCDAILLFWLYIEYLLEKVKNYFLKICIIYFNSLHNDWNKNSMHPQERTIAFFLCNFQHDRENILLMEVVWHFWLCTSLILYGDAWALWWKILSSYGEIDAY